MISETRHSFCDNCGREFIVQEGDTEQFCWYCWEILNLKEKFDEPRNQD